MAETNEDCLSVNSDFELIPNTPMECEMDEGQQEAPKGFVASEFGGNQSEKPASMFVFLEVFVKLGNICVAKISKLNSICQVHYL